MRFGVAARVAHERALLEPSRLRHGYIEPHRCPADRAPRTKKNIKIPIQHGTRTPPQNPTPGYICVAAPAIIGAAIEPCLSPVSTVCRQRPRLRETPAYWW